MHIDRALQESKNSKRNKDNQMNDLYIISEPINTFNKIIIDIHDITDFGFCPLYYDLKHKDNKEKNLKTLYDESLHKIFYSYLLAFQEDKLDDRIGFLKYMWGKEWIGHKTKEDILITNSPYMRDTYETRRKKGIDAIFKFDNIINKDDQFPIIIGHKYKIEILPNIVLTGIFEYVREIKIKKQRIIQVVKFLSESNRSITNFARQYNLDMIAMSYAFKELFNVDYFQSVLIDMDNNKIITNIFTDKEYNILKQTVKNTIISLQNNIKCISPDSKCSNCEYRNVCIKSI